MKKTFKFIIILIITMALFGIGNKVEASSTAITSDKTEVNVGDTITITATVTAAQWDLKITLNGTEIATSSELDNYESNITKTITATYQAKSEGNLTFVLEGDVTDVSQKVEKVNKSVKVNVKKVETPKPTQDPEPEKPKVEEKPEFKDANRTMYATKDINLRASWSTSSAATKVEKGTELKVTATSSNKVNGYVWYRVTYNGKTLYVASNLLTSTKPEEQTTEQPTEEPIEKPIEEPQTNDENETDEVKEGLKSLEIEGITLSPAFSPDVYEYRVILKEDISKLEINAVAVSEGATITIAGNENLQEGENLIIIVVYNSKNEVEATYQITTNKNTLDLTNTDKMLQLGTKEAKQNVIIFITILAIAIVGLIVIMILKYRNKNYEDDYEDDYEEDDIENYQEKEFTDSEENVENTQKEIMEDAEEINKAKKDKRKGKHF